MKTLINVKITCPLLTKKIPDARNLFQINETNLIEHLTPSEWRHFVGPDTSELLDML